jgi:predicted aconitase
LGFFDRADFLNPLLGLAVGAASGAVSGALTDVGLDDNFMKQLAATINPGSSVLFVLVRHATPDKVLQELQGSGGKVLKTPLSHEDKAKLQAALSAAKQQNEATAPPINRTRTLKPEIQHLKPATGSSCRGFRVGSWAGSRSL